MANLDTDIYTNQTTRDISLHVDQSLRPIQQVLRFARFEYTIPDAGVTAADKLRLGFLKVSNAKIVPELSRITSQGTGAAVVLTLKKCDADGTETALTAAATLAENSVALARPSTLAVPEVEEEDYLFLLLGTVTTETAGTVILVEIAYYSEQAN